MVGVSTVHGHPCLPTYVLIADELEGSMLRGEYPAGSRLPTERELAGRAGVNRNTAAKALNYLQSKGLIVRVRGRGTFARPPRIECRLTERPSFTEAISRVGLKPSHRIVGVRRVRAYGRLIEELGVPPGEPLVALERVRFAGEIPLNYGTKHFRETLFPGLHHHLPLGGGSLRALIRSLYGRELYRARTTFEIEPADEGVSPHLGVQLGAATFKVERLDVLEDGTPAEWGVTYFRGDVAKIRMSTRVVKGDKN
jgi:DNA-binding GntR family transcriptional regulator